MKVLQVVSSLDPVHGGPPTVVLKLSAALAQQGCDVTIHSSENPERIPHIVSTFSGVPGLDSVRVELEPRSGIRERWLPTSVADYIRTHAREFDLVHAHSLWMPSLVTALRTAQQRRIPTVITPHGTLAKWPMRQRTLKKKVALQLCWRKLLSRATFVQMLTAAEARDFRLFGFPSPVEIIPNGISPEEVRQLPPRGSFFSAHPELQGNPFVLFLARLHYVKRPELLLLAFSRVAERMPNARLVVAGPDCGLGTQLVRLAAQLGMAARIHFTGPLYGAEKYAAMVDASCFCQTSVYETFSMSLLEAMACATPVVITEGCNFDEVQTAGAGIVVDAVPERLADALTLVLSDRRACSEFGSKAQSLVLQKYTWPDVARRMIAGYERHASRGFTVAGLGRSPDS